eukprot:944383-Pyramimonas_sp.AAC.1
MLAIEGPLEKSGPDARKAFAAWRDNAIFNKGGKGGGKGQGGGMGGAGDSAVELEALTQMEPHELDGDVPAPAPADEGVARGAPWYITIAVSVARVGRSLQIQMIQNKLPTFYCE